MNEEIQKAIDDSIIKALAYSTIKYGDTPTDALQLAPKKYVDSKATKIYSGSVGSDGGALDLPTGWSSVKNTTGDYTLTHNLGTSKYNIVGSGTDGVLGTIYFYIKGVNSITVYTKTGTSAADIRFDFILIPY